MGLNLRTLFLGVFLFGVMIIALFSFSSEWSNDLGVSVSEDLSNINAELNVTMNSMYGQAKDDEGTLEESSIYTGSSQLDLVSTDAYRALKNNFKILNIVSNATSSGGLSLGLPSWVWVLASGAFMITIGWLILAVIFRVRNP